jgi:UDP-N-acetyl-D-mannosaminuronic acid dehydrogenase
MIFKNICVLGLGYIGLPTASILATFGVNVIGVDTSPDVVHTLQNGNIHIQEPGLRALVQAALGSNHLIIGNSPVAADAFIIAVPTPFKDNKKADLSYVISAAQSIVPVLQPDTLVVLESTSPPRTTIETLAPILAQSGLTPGEDFYLAYCPERVLPGQILRELIENDRVVGGINKTSADACRDLYSIFVRGHIFLTDSTTAEMVKLMENSFRDINIAIANEFALLGERVGINVWEAISIANRHPRVNILQPGPGVGGHCISVDPWFLVETAPGLTPLIHTAREVNDNQPNHVVDLICNSFQDNTQFLKTHSTDSKICCKGKRITILGLTYKPNVDDLRESPAIDVARKLSKIGALVKAYDPFKPGVKFNNFIATETLEEALVDAELIALLVSHRSFQDLTPSQIAKKTQARIILDTVNSWSAKPWEENGFKFILLGDGIGLMPPLRNDVSADTT